MQKLILSLALLALTVPVVHATPTPVLPLKTWVSSTGSGTTCSRAAPCATFQIAHDNTAAGGEIGVVDSGEYGQVAITKSISIVAVGAEAAILANGIGIQVTAGANDIIHLRGLNIDGGGNGSYGIIYTSGAALHIDKCVIKNFVSSVANTGFAVILNANSSAPTGLYVSDTVLINNGGVGFNDGGGIWIEPSAAAPVRIVLNRVEANNNYRGIKADGGASGGSGSIMNINIRDSVVGANTNNGIVATTPANGGTILMTLDRVTSSNNGNNPATVGVVSDGPHSLIRLSNSIVTGNWNGLSFTNGATLESFGNNEVRGNSVDGSPSATVGLK